MSLVRDIAGICRELDESPADSTMEGLAAAFGREAGEELMDLTEGLWPHDPRFAGAVLTGIIIGYRLGRKAEE